MSSVTSLSVSGYKSIKQLENFPMSSLNVLIGVNGASKSNFISLFRLINKMYEQNLQLYVQLHGGPDALLHFGRNETEALEASLYFKNNSYHCSLLASEDNRLIFKDETNEFEGVHFDTTPRHSLGTGHDESKLKGAEDDRYSGYVRSGVKSWQVYNFHDTSNKAKIKQRHGSNDNLKLKMDGANLAAYLQMEYRLGYIKVTLINLSIMCGFGIPDK